MACRRRGVDGRERARQLHRGDRADGRAAPDRRLGAALTAPTRPSSGTVVAGLAGAAALIALVNVASRVVGFLRWFVMANQVGPNALGNAYASANTLPNVLFEVVAGGALAGAVVPLIAVPLARSIRKDVDRTASALLGWALVALVPLAVVVAAASRPIVAALMAGRPDAEIDVAATFLTVFAPQIPLYGIGVVLTGVLQAQRKFLAAALAPLLNSLVVIATFFAFGQIVDGPKDDPGAIADSAILLLGWGTTAGVAVMSLPLLWPVLRTGVRLRPTLAFPPGVAARARALAMAGLGALVAQQASVVVNLVVANRYGGSGTWAVVAISQAVYFLPYAVLAFPLATASLPRLAERAATGDRDGFAALTAVTTRAVLAVSVLGAATLIAVAPAVEQVFVVVADGDVTGMGSAITAMAPGLLGFALILHLSRALYALDRGRLAVVATALGWLVVAGTAAAVVPVLSTGADQPATLLGLGIANTVGMTVAGVGLVLAVVRAAGRDAVAGIGRTGATLLVGGTLAGGVGRLVVAAMPAEGVAAAVGAGVVGALVGAVLLMAVVWLFDRSAFGAIRGRARRRPGPAEPRVE